MKLPELKPVTSSNIKAIGYDPESKTMAVHFGGDHVYAYADVPADTHKALVESSSIGSHFHANIKGKFVHTKHKRP